MLVGNTGVNPSLIVIWALCKLRGGQEAIFVL